MPLTESEELELLELEEEEARTAAQRQPRGATRDFSNVKRGGALNEITGNIAAGIHGMGEGVTLGLLGKTMTPLQKAREAELKEAFPVAYGAGDIASYFVGAPAAIGKGIVKAGAKALPKVTRPVLRALARIGGQAATGAAIGGVTEGAKGTIGEASQDVSLRRGIEKAKGGAIGGAVFGGGLAAVGEGVSALAKASKGTANHIIRTVLRPGKKGEIEGFDPENLFKHKLVGKDIDEIGSKTGSKLKDLRGQLKSIEESGTAKGVDIDIKKAVEDARRTLIGNKKINFHDREAAEKLFDKVELDAWKASNGGKFSISDAMAYKTDTGAKGSWIKGALQRGANPDLAPQEEVYNAVYRKVKDAINTAVESSNLGDIKAINKQFEEVIPIANAVARRAGTLKGNMAVSPLELILMGTGTAAGAISAITGDEKGKRGIGGVAAGLAMAGAARGLRSPTVARGLYKIGQTGAKKIPSLTSLYK